jgi:hypothetical protein
MNVNICKYVCVHALYFGLRSLRYLRAACGSYIIVIQFLSVLATLFVYKARTAPKSCTLRRCMQRVSDTAKGVLLAFGRSWMPVPD